MSRTNASALEQRYRDRINVLEFAIATGMRRALNAIDREQVKNLSGTGEPGSYPVPVRKGTLRGGHGWAIAADGQSGQVFNTTVYATAVHSGELTTRDGRRYAVRPREFLDDAAEKVDHMTMIEKEIMNAKAFQALSS